MPQEIHTSQLKNMVLNSTKTPECHTALAVISCLSTALSMVTMASPSVCECVRALVLALWQVSHPSAVFAVWPL